MMQEDCRPKMTATKNAPGPMASAASQSTAILLFALTLSRAFDRLSKITRDEKSLVWLTSVPEYPLESGLLCRVHGDESLPRLDLFEYKVPVSSRITG